MVLAILLIVVYCAGFLMSIYPIYFKLVVAKRKAKRNSILDDSNYTAVAIYATVGALFWFLATPFYLSHWLHNRHRFNLADVKAKATEFEKRRLDYEQIRASVQADADRAMREALRELDAGSGIDLNQISRPRRPKSQWD